MAALQAIDMDVMLFLFGMFVVGEALELSGYLEHLSYKMFRRARTTDQLVLLVLFGVGAASALLMNDTLAIVGAPIMLALSKRHGISPKMMLIALAFAVTLGSVASPIGNPQNLIIALDSGMSTPFVTFFQYLILPTILSILLAFLVLKIFFAREFHDRPLAHEDSKTLDPKLALLSKAALWIIVAAVAAKVAFAIAGIDYEIRLTYIALAGGLPILLLSSRRVEIVRGVDWPTLAFFAAMFVLMAAVWNSGFFQAIIEGSDISISSTVMIIAVSILMSQVISNVPLVALYLPMLVAAGVGDRGFAALAAGSTIAGNLLIIGAASNVIIIQNAEKRGETLTFREFAKVGAPLTLVTALVYCVFLML
jgi:Na+/H+ antiporter NhaD/arsenite permease-like protein